MGNSYRYLAILSGHTAYNVVVIIKTKCFELRLRPFFFFATMKRTEEKCCTKIEFENSFFGFFTFSTPPVWPDGIIKSIQKLSKYAKTFRTADFTKMFFQYSLKSYFKFGLLLLENESPRTFKKRPIWSHCAPQKALG